MHATLAAPLPIPSAPVQLNSFERAVALYVSDMPTGTRFHKTDAGQVERWIAQGIERLGLRQVRTGGEFLRSFNLRLTKRRVTADDEAAYRRWFPSTRRSTSAQSLVAMVAMYG